MIYKVSPEQRSESQDAEELSPATRPGTSMPEIPEATVLLEKPSVEIHRTVTSDALESLLDKLLLGGRKGWNEAFRLLVFNLGGSGGEVGIISPSAFCGTTADPQILISCGAYQRTSDREDIIKFFYNFWRHRETASSCATKLVDDEPTVVCCAVPYSKHKVLGVVIWDTKSTRAEDFLFLQIFARLLAHLSGGGSDINPPTQPKNHEVKKFPEEYVEGCSEIMRSFHSEIKMLSQVDIPLLLLGETGVGKEHTAQLLHNWSNRRDGPFIAVNCAAIPPELLEAEMFGISRGVATGVSEREGYFQLADGGTLFLDEIAELQPPLQAKLLRALQDKEVRRVGGAMAKADVRIVAATNADLQSRMEKGSFRPDLYYRVAGFELHVPPLRERKGDLPLFIEHFLRLFTQESGKIVSGITLKALERLNEYYWPGNVREFAHEMRRLVYLCPEGQPIGVELLSARILAPGPAESGGAANGIGRMTLEAAIEKMERSMILEALFETNGNRTRAAKLLGVTRNGLALKMERLGIKF
jgi:DNA-binding NtrC family response regulator